MGVRVDPRVFALGSIVAVGILVGCGGGSSSTKSAPGQVLPAKQLTAPRRAQAVPLSTASPGTITIYPLPTGVLPMGITTGPDQLYFAEYGADAIDSIGYDGTLGTPATLSAASAEPSQIVEAANGSMFFSTYNHTEFGNLTPPATGSGGTILEWNEFGSSGGTNGIASDANGILWVTDYVNNSVTRVTDWGSILTRTALASGTEPFADAVGDDGSTVWVTEMGANKIAELNSSGVLVTSYAVPKGSAPFYITADNAGNIWFTENTETTQGYLGKLVASTGAITMYALPAVGAGHNLVQGSDGNIWIAFYTANAILSFNPSTATFTSYALAEHPAGIAAGADGQVWFTESADTGGTPAIGSIQP
jgi:virginiamycin B lyase